MSSAASRSHRWCVQGQRTRWEKAQSAAPAPHGVVTRRCPPLFASISPSPSRGGPPHLHSPSSHDSRSESAEATSPRRGSQLLTFDRASLCVCLRVGWSRPGIVQFGKSTIREHHERRHRQQQHSQHLSSQESCGAAQDGGLHG